MGRLGPEVLAIKIMFPYENHAGMEIPSANLLGVYQAPDSSASESMDSQIQHALQHPQGTARLSKLARGKNRVLIVTDDVARPTPAWRIIPHVLNELTSAGVSDGSIQFMMALGTHRPMTEEEMRAKVGDAVFARFPVFNHAWDDPEALTSIGYDERGVEVWVNKKVVEADFVIGIGRIMPIDICGFTGGGKILIPGCCGASTIDEIHWNRVDLSDDDVIGKRENPVRAAIDAMARKAGLDFIVNVVTDSHDQILNCVAGDFVEAHAAGCQKVRACLEVPIPHAPDIVVVDAYPFDIDLWQTNKAIDTAGIVVREGGVVICVSPCYEGISAVHGDVIYEFGYRSCEEVKALVDSGAIVPRVIGVHMIQLGHVAIDKAHLIMVTSGISDADLERVGLNHAPTPQVALDMAFERLGADATVAVLRGGAEMLPKVG